MQSAGQEVAQLIDICSSLISWNPRYIEWQDKLNRIPKHALYQSYMYFFKSTHVIKFVPVILVKVLYKNRQLENDYSHWVFCQFGKEPIKFLLPLFGGWTSTDQFVASMDNFTKESYSSNFFYNCMTDNTYSISGLTQEDRHFVFQCLEGRFLSRQQK